jgi:heptaprenyl diphosphate synthase
LNQCVQLKTELFHAFTDILDDKMIRAWSELLHGFGRCEVVLDELNRSEKPERFGGSWGYWHVLHEGTEEEKLRLAEKPEETSFVVSVLAKYDIRSQLADKLKHSVTHVQAVASRIESDKLVRELLQIGETFLRPLLPAASAHGERR